MATDLDLSGLLKRLQDIEYNMGTQVALNIISYDKSVEHKACGQLLDSRLCDSSNADKILINVTPPHW